jgi:hypothetical protein
MLKYNRSKEDTIKTNKRRILKMKNIVNHKKIAQELVKNFYSKRQFQAWNVVDYDDLTKLVIFNGYSILRVFKEDFLIAENKYGFKPEELKKCFDEDLSGYKKATNIEIKKKYDEANKKFYTCFDGEVYIDDDMLKYLDSKQEYKYWYKAKKAPIFVTTTNDFKVAMILPVNVSD